MKTKDFERYVKVSHSDNLHNTLFKISEACNKLSTDTNSLKTLENEKHRIYAEARSVGRSLLADIHGLNSYLGEPASLAANEIHHTRRVVPHRVARKRAKVTPARKARPTKKATPKRYTSAKKSSPRVTAPKRKGLEETANLKRLKANLDAIRASLK